MNWSCYSAHAACSALFTLTGRQQCAAHGAHHLCDTVRHHMHAHARMSHQERECLALIQRDGQRVKAHSCPCLATFSQPARTARPSQPSPRPAAPPARACAPQREEGEEGRARSVALEEVLQDKGRAQAPHLLHRGRGGGFWGGGGGGGWRESGKTKRRKGCGRSYRDGDELPRAGTCRGGKRGCRMGVKFAL